MFAAGGGGGGGGHTEKQPSGWSIDTLKEHMQAALEAADTRYEQRFLAQEKAVREALAAQEKAVGAALTAAEKAVAVAERNAEEWRKGANEWRGSMTDRERKFVAVPELEALKERLQGVSKHTADAFISATDRIAALEKSYYEGRGRETVSDPMMAAALAEMRLRTKAGDVQSGERRGSRDLMYAIGIVVTIVIAAFALYIQK